jgi:hypothetical protein
MARAMPKRVKVTVFHPPFGGTGYFLYIDDVRFFSDPSITNGRERTVHRVDLGK